ncbi:MAG: hypothetical protein R2705_19970 [Ilumatobacteraceae bacterium]
MTTTSTSTTVATGTASGALSAAESGNFVERRNQGDFRVGAAVVGLTLLAADRADDEVEGEEVGPRRSDGR